MAMFSQSQLEKIVGKKKISQDTFDAAVKENIDEFEMEAEEAVTSAIQEFEAQGVDLSGIIKTAAGGDISSHPASQATKALDAAVAAASQGSSLEALASLTDIVDGAQPAERDALLAVLFRAEALWALVRCLTSWPDSEAVALPTLRLMPQLLGSRDQQSVFCQARAAAAIQGVIAKHAGSAEVLGAALCAAGAGGVRSEDGKAAVMEAGLASTALQLLEREGDSPEVVQGACAVLNTVTNPDDDTQPSSRAFPNARALGKMGAAVALVGALARHEAQAQETTAALCTALKQVAANDEICQEVLAAGGVKLVLAVLQSGMSQARLARPATSLLRQLASSDSCKAAILESGGLDVISRLLEAHPTNYAVQDQALGLLTNMTLRNPDAAVRAVEGGCTDRVMQAMRGLLAAGEPVRTQSAQRQACMALRNIAARSPELRPILLERGCERVLRSIKLAYPGSLASESASAALRDLGVDNYND